MKLRICLMIFMACLLSACEVQFGSSPLDTEGHSLNAAIVDKWWTENEDREREWFIEAADIYGDNPNVVINIGDSDESAIWNLIRIEDEYPYYIVYTHYSETGENTLDRIYYTDIDYHRDLDRRYEEASE